MLRESSRKGAKAQEAGKACRAVLVFAVAWYSRFSRPGFALCALRKVLRCCGKDHAKAKAEEAGMACRAVLGIRSGLV